MLVALGKIKEVTRRDWNTWTTMEKMGAMEAAEKGAEAIGECVVLLWEAQYPRSLYVLPAVRPVKDFD